MSCLGSSLVPLKSLRYSKIDFKYLMFQGEIYVLIPMEMGNLPKNVYFHFITMEQNLPHAQGVDMTLCGAQPKLMQTTII